VIALRSLRFDVSEICRRSGIDEKSVSNPHHFVPESTIWAVWREASAQSETSALGLRAGAIVPFGTYGVLNYLSMTARTLGEGLGLLARYWPLIGTGKRLVGPSLQCRDYTLAVMTNHMFARSGLRPRAPRCSTRGRRRPSPSVPGRSARACRAAPRTRRAARSAVPRTRPRPAATRS
jgi:hypothetical protein